MTFRWDSGRRPSQAWDISRYKDALAKAVLKLLDEYWSPQVETDAKNNAVWTDRTGNARQTLAAFGFESDKDVMTLVLRQTMDYGKWLELRFDQKYAIVLRTLEQYYAPIWASVRGLVE